jgi:hypothetical protein
MKGINARERRLGSGAASDGVARYAVPFCGVVMACGIVVLTRCSLVTSYDCLDAPCVDQPGKSDAAPSPTMTATAPAMTTAQATAACPLEKAPPKPSASPPGQEGEYVVVMNQVVVEAEAGKPAIGLDLDNACTCLPGGAPGDRQACSNKRSDPPTPETTCDGRGGIDNQFSKVLRDPGFRGFFGNAALADALRIGKLGTLVRLQGYNGSANDSSVRVNLFNGVTVSGMSTGTNTDAGADAGAPDASNADASFLPRFNPDETWTVDTKYAYTSGPTEVSSAFAADGWVTQGRLSVAFPAPLVLVFSLATPSGRTPVKFEVAGASLVANVSIEGGTMKLTDGILAGKWPMASALQIAASLISCDKKDVIYNNVRELLCAAADLGTQGEACDGISITFGFSGVPAKLGALERAIGPSCPSFADDCTR